MKEEPIIKVGTWKGWSFLAAALTENIRKGRPFSPQKFQYVKTLCMN
jgi:hypothetical protein